MEPCGVEPMVPCGPVLQRIAAGPEGVRTGRVGAAPNFPGL
jgi:hypothetical protein